MIYTEICYMFFKITERVLCAWENIYIKHYGKLKILKPSLHLKIISKIF